MAAPVTIVSCLYGDRGYDHFIADWSASIGALSTQPEDVIVSADREYVIPRQLRISVCAWQYPQAFYLQDAIMAATSEWVWILDMDDIALPDALDGIDDVKADVWQLGYRRSDGETYVPPQLTGSEYLESSANPFVAGSAIKTEAFWRSGGFPDVAFQDFGLWRRLARSGASFKASDRAHYRYNRHPGTRSAVELRPEKREQFLAELMESEAVAVT